MFNISKPITPESYSEKINAALPKLIKSIVLFGSAASGERVEKRSDYNLLVVTENIGVLELNQIAKVTTEWLKAGNPPPLFFTLDRLRGSADCFPIEMLDMKQFYKVIHGDDVLKDIVVHPTHLRLMTEREIKSLKIQLRQGVIYANGNPDKVAELIQGTASTALVLLRAALRLYTQQIPSKKTDIPAALAAHVKIEADVFNTAYKLRKGEIKTKEISPMELFDRYLKNLVIVGDAVDGMAKR